MRPLPPSDPNMIGPSRLAQHNSRLKRREGLILPTPRTYRTAALTASSLTSTSTSPVLLGTMDVWMQPGETLGVMASVDIRRQTAVAATALFYASTTQWGTASLFPTSADLTYAANAYATYASSQVQPTDAIVGNQRGQFFYFMDHVGNTGLTAPGTVTVSFYGYRTTGTAVVEFTKLNMWAMVI